MLKKLIGLEAGERIVDFHAYFRDGLLPLLLAACAAAAVSVYLYRRERTLTRGRRIFMGICHALTLTLMAVILLQPVLDVRIVKPMKRTILVLLDTSASMAIRDLRSHDADVEDAAWTAIDVGGQKTNALPAGADAWSRLELGQSALAHPAMTWAGELARDYDMRFFAFDESLSPAVGETGTADWLGKRGATGMSSRVGSAIAEAAERHAGQPLAGVVVLSDFAWIGGRDPAEVAREMKLRGIPIFPVGIGVSSQPDFSVTRIVAPDVAFAGDNIPLRIQVASSGFEGQEGTLALTVNGEAVSSLPLTFSGGVQFAEIPFRPTRAAGTVELEVALSGPPGEVNAGNNRAEHRIRILDEKIDVLYVEGLPRWEYRYLRWVLLRDPRLNVRFLMTEGDPTLASTTPGHLAAFPEDAAEIMKYDLVILGDVPAGYFNGAQLDRMEELVRVGGGALLMLAGPVGAPTSYAQTPIAKVLPVRFVNEPWRAVADERHPIVTQEGLRSPCTSLLSPAEANARLWSRVRPLSHVPPLEGAKPGATTLLELSDDIADARTYPLVAWHRYGKGKAMFVGCEQLWRLRWEEGSTYHARFWGQTIQFLALSRLLGANKQIALETDRRMYNTGEQIDIFASVLDEAFVPVSEPSFRVLLEQQDRAQTPLELELEPLPNSPGLYAGVHLATEEGTYAVKTLPAQREISNVAEFDVKTTPLEQRETDMQANVVRQVAELSGGKPYRLSELGALPGELHQEKAMTQFIRRERDLWDLPFLFVAIVALTGVEWFLRRRDNMV